MEVEQAPFAHAIARCYLAILSIEHGYLKSSIWKLYLYTVLRESLAGGKVWQFWQFTKLKPSKLVLSINNLLADLLIRQIFFCQMLEKSQFAKLSSYMVVAIANRVSSTKSNRRIAVNCMTCLLN